MKSSSDMFSPSYGESWAWTASLVSFACTGRGAATIHVIVTAGLKARPLGDHGGSQAHWRTQRVTRPSGQSRATLGRGSEISPLLAGSPAASGPTCGRLALGQCDS